MLPAYSIYNINKCLQRKFKSGEKDGMELQASWAPHKDPVVTETLTQTKHGQQCALNALFS